MSFRISSNGSSLSAGRMLSQTTKALARSLERLASGSRVNSAKDDAAGLAISNGLEAQRRGLLRGVQNMNEAQSVLKTADGALASQIELVQRMKELAVQASSGTLSDSDRNSLNFELAQLTKEFERIGSQTSLNGSSLLDGSLSQLSIQIGSEKSQSVSLSVAASNLQTSFVEHVSSGVFTLVRETTREGYSVGSTDPVVGDFNNDGFDDYIEVAGNLTGYLHLSCGDGTFSSGVTLALQSGPGGYNMARPAMITGDVNSDGNLDLITGNQLPTTGNIEIRLGDGQGNFTFAEFTNGDQEGYGFIDDGFSTYSFNSGDYIHTQIVDVNRDGYQDIVGSNDAGYIATMLGRADGKFTFTPVINIAMGLDAVQDRIQIADINSDGNVDYLFSDTVDDKIYTALGNGDGTFAAITSFAVAAQLQGGARLGDANGDGHVDILQATDSNTIAVRLGQGNGTFTTGTTISITMNSRATPELYDFNNDGKNDLLISSYAEIRVALGNGNGTFAASKFLMTPNMVSQRESIVQDLNKDGYLDIIAFGSEGVATFMGSANGTFRKYLTSENLQGELMNIDADPMGFATGDFNGDGFTDVAATSEFYNLGPTTFPEKMFILLGESEQISARTESINISTQESAQLFLEIADSALRNLYQRRSSIGALQNRLTSAADVASVTVENISVAKSNLSDVDYAGETAELVRLQILQQAEVAVLTQANSQMQAVLQLLRT